MAFDPNRWTLKTQEAVNAAMEAAKRAGHPELTPDHLVVELLGQSEGVVLPILQRAGTPPADLRTRATEALDALPKAYGGSDPSLSKDLADVIDAADLERADLGDDYLSTEHLLLALAERYDLDQKALRESLTEVRGSHRVTSQNPEDQFQALEKVRPRPHRGRPSGQARPGHRP